INPASPRREISDRQRNDFKNAIANPPTTIDNSDPIYISVNSDHEEARRYGKQILDLLRDSGLKATLDQTTPNRDYFEGLKFEGTTWGNVAQVVERAFKKADIKCEFQLTNYSKARNVIIIGSAP